MYTMVSDVAYATILYPRRAAWRYKRSNQNPYIKKVQHNDQTKKDKMANNDLQNTTQKTKDGATRTH